MKSNTIAIFITYFITISCSSALAEQDEDEPLTNNHPEPRSAISFRESKSNDRLNDDIYSYDNSLVRFEDDLPKPSNEPHFFPTEPDTHNPVREDTQKEDIGAEPLYDDEHIDFQEEEERFEPHTNIINKESTEAFKGHTSGRVIFEDNIKKKNPEPVGHKRRKQRREQNLFNNGFNYPGYPRPGYAAQYPASSDLTDKRPGLSQYRPEYEDSNQGYGLYPGYQLINPLPIKPGESAQLAQVNSGGQASLGTPVYSGYLQSTGSPGNNKYGFAANPNLYQGQYIPKPGLQGYGLQQRRPKSLTQQAVSAVAEALTSIALFDDKQCVPRLLCEVASGRAAGSPTLMKATAGLGPLLSILQSYDSTSSSPLFLFGRAAVLGMTSIGNTISCHRAYPQCPRDPAELINYLNNHNGGFFRFFGQPVPQKQQNLEQFYNHLSGQSGNQETQQQNYAYTYGNGNKNQYPKNNELNNYRREDTFVDLKEADNGTFREIQERIQNKPNIDAVDEENEEDVSKWTFPEESNNKRRRKPRKKSFTTVERVPIDEREGVRLRFPDENQPKDDTERELIRKQKVKFFPNENALDFGASYQTNNALNEINLQDYVFDYKHKFYVKRPKQINNLVDDGAELVYIVRGNGDPNHPEIVKVKPGQRA